MFTNEIILSMFFSYFYRLIFYNQTWGFVLRDVAWTNTKCLHWKQFNCDDIRIEKWQFNLFALWNWGCRTGWSFSVLLILFVFNVQWRNCSCSYIDIIVFYVYAVNTNLCAWSKKIELLAASVFACSQSKASRK